MTGKWWEWYLICGSNKPKLPTDPPLASTHIVENGHQFSVFTNCVKIQMLSSIMTVECKVKEHINFSNTAHNIFLSCVYDLSFVVLICTYAFWFYPLVSCIHTLNLCITQYLCYFQHGLMLLIDAFLFIILSVELCADVEENPGLWTVNTGGLSEKSAVLSVFILFPLFYIDSIP